jgi:hypothetical protein
LRYDDFTIEAVADLRYEVQVVRCGVDVGEYHAAYAGLAGDACHARRRQVSRYGGVVGEGAFDEKGVGTAGQPDHGLAVLGVAGVHERAALGTAGAHESRQPASSMGEGHS